MYLGSNQEPRVTVVFLALCTDFNFLGKGKGRASFVWYRIVLIYYANTQCCIESSLAAIAHL